MKKYLLLEKEYMIMTETEKLFEFIEDLELILNQDDEYFLRYDEETDEVLTNILGDGDIVTIYDMNNKLDRRNLVLDIIKFIRENKK